MIPKETMHFVNGKQLCDRQYAYYRERLGYEAGFRAGKEESIKSFTMDSFRELKEFIEAKHGRHRAMSITVWQAIREFLEVKDE